MLKSCTSLVLAALIFSATAEAKPQNERWITQNQCDELGFVLSGYYLNYARRPQDSSDWATMSEKRRQYELKTQEWSFEQAWKLATIYSAVCK